MFEKIVSVLLILWFCGCATPVVKSPAAIVNIMGDGPDDPPVQYRNDLVCHDNTFTGDCPDDLEIDTGYERIKLLGN